MVARPDRSRPVTRKISLGPQFRRESGHNEFLSMCANDVNPSSSAIYKPSPIPSSGGRLTTLAPHKDADSDEVARAFRDDVARRSDMMSPGCGASLADNLWHSVVGRSILGAPKLGR
jgi:hypothetical protein